ncbi:MAG: papain-like cysteine protease family protein [Acidobacteriota bacterium]
MKSDRTAAPGNPTCRPDGSGMEICEASACTFLASVAPNAQEESNWCWAACLEMSFSCLGNRVTQFNIVKATWGDIRNAPASPAEIVTTVNREYVNNMGGRFRPKARLLDRTFTIFTNMGALAATFEHVSAGKPAIVGTLNPDGTGHATMLTHLTVRRPVARGALPELHSARVYDPWLKGGSRVFTQDDWNRSPYIILIDL